MECGDRRRPGPSGTTAHWYGRAVTVEGIRSFRLAADRLGPALGSPLTRLDAGHAGRARTWPSRVLTAARCTHGKAAPCVQGCGVYAWANLACAVHWMGYGILGRVTFTGPVLGQREHVPPIETRFLALRGRRLELVELYLGPLVSHAAGALADRYEVPVHVYEGDGPRAQALDFLRCWGGPDAEELARGIGRVLLVAGDLSPLHAIGRIGWAGHLLQREQMPLSVVRAANERFAKVEAVEAASLARR